MSRPLKSVNIQQLNEDQTTRALRDALVELTEIANETDFEDSGHIDQFKSNILFLKLYYDRLEHLIRNG